MSKKKATHCSTCGDAFMCGEEYISFKFQNLCWTCYADFHEKELEREYAVAQVVTSTYVNYILHDYLFGKPIISKYGKDVMTWARHGCPIQLKALRQAHKLWKSGETKSLAPLVVEFSQQIAREMNAWQPY